VRLSGPILSAELLSFYPHDRSPIAMVSVIFFETATEAERAGKAALTSLSSVHPD
jgi:hypothetical protein